MQNVSVARRYARALLDAAGAEADEVLGQLEALLAFLEGQPELHAALRSPTLSRPERMTVLEAMLRGAGVHVLVMNLLKLLTDRNRFDVLASLARQYRDLVDVRMGRVRGRVTSAVKLGDDQLAAIERSLEALTQRKVVLETSVDRSLIAGVVAQVGSKTFDGSTRTQLRELERSLGASGH